MSFSLIVIVQLLQDDVPVLPLQCLRKDQVAEVRVLGEHGPVAVGAEHVAVSGPFRAVLAVVSVARQDFADGPDALAQIGAAGVVLKAHHGLAVQFVAGKHVVSDEPAFLSFRPDVDAAHELHDLSFPGLIVVTEDLITAADGQERLVVLDGRLDVRLLVPVRVRQKHILLEVLTSADEEEVVLARVQVVSHGEPRHFAVDASPLQAFLHAEDVARVAVQIQKIGVQMAYVQFHVHSQNFPPPASAESLSRTVSMEV